MIIIPTLATICWTGCPLGGAIGPLLQALPDSESFLSLVNCALSSSDSITDTLIPSSLYKLHLTDQIYISAVYSLYSHHEVVASMFPGLRMTIKI